MFKLKIISKNLMKFGAVWKSQPQYCMLTKLKPIITYETFGNFFCCYCYAIVCDRKWLDKNKYNLCLFCHNYYQIHIQYYQLPLSEYSKLLNLYYHSIIIITVNYNNQNEFTDFKLLHIICIFIKLNNYPNTLSTCQVYF